MLIEKSVLRLEFCEDERQTYLRLLSYFVTKYLFVVLEKSTGLIIVKVKV